MEVSDVQGVWTGEKTESKIQRTPKWRGVKSAFDRVYAKEHRDVKAPDGALAHGWRWVRAPGRLKFAGSWFSHGKLAQYIGQHVLVYAASDHVQAVEVYATYTERIVSIESGD